MTANKTVDFYPGDIVEPTIDAFRQGWTCPIDMVNSDSVRLAIDGVYGPRRWLSKSSVILRRRPFRNSVRDFITRTIKRFAR